MSVTLNNLIHTDIRNDEGQSPLDLALEGMFDVHSCNVPLYLINRGCGDDKDKDKLLCEACRCGNLDVVKELVEEHDRDPKGEYISLSVWCVMIKCKVP